MSRWRISDPNRTRDRELPGPSGLPEAAESARHSAGMERPADSPGHDRADHEPTIGERLSIQGESRRRYPDQGRRYLLRRSEMEALADVGRFRVVDVKDLSRVVYRGDIRGMEQDLRNLRAQGLIEGRSLDNAHKSARKLVTLTESGERILNKFGGLPKEQRTYHGFVKLRELDHDADLYRVYHKAVREIEERGGKPLRVRLDFELKESINQAKEGFRVSPVKERVEMSRLVAERHGLAVRGATIHLPDIQIEYQSREGEIHRENLELVSRNYRAEGIRGKAASGFKIYARGGETSRIRRALGDTGLIREVLSA